MAKFDVVLFNMSNYSEWMHGVSNRNFHIFKQLLANPDVGKILAVDYLPITFKRSVRNWKNNVLFSHIKDGQVISKTPGSRLTKVSDKLYVYSDINFYLSPETTIKNINKIKKNLDFQDTIVWSYLPYVARYWNGLKAQLKVFDAVDNWLLHSSYQSKKNLLEKSYDLIKKEADVIFAVSSHMVHFFGDGPNVYWIPNGVDLKHYSRVYPLVNRDIADIKKPIIGYIGVMQDRVDFDLIKFIAQKNADKSLVLIGPVWAKQATIQQELATYPNVHFLGYKSYEEAPMYVQQFDLGIVPHKTSGLSTSTNPMKIYEYLACGKAVVGTDHSGLDNFSDIISVAKDYEDFNQKINEALSSETNEKKEERLNFVKKYSWFNTVSKMMELIKAKIS